ncbi:putative response regulator domain protein [Candidatus Hepatincolaceae symbiont of Richtersius coronifer]
MRLKKYITHINADIILQLIFFIFLVGLPILSLLFYYNPPILYKIADFLFIDISFIRKILPIGSKLVLFYLWLANLIIIPLWIYKSFFSQARHKNIINLLAKQGKNDKLLSYMVTDSWGKIIWVSDLFKQIFKIKSQEEQYINNNFLNILSNSTDMKISDIMLSEIANNFKFKKAGILDLPIKIALQDSAFRLTYININSFYIWQIMLVQNNYLEQADFSKDLLYNLSVPVIVIGFNSQTLYANDAFKELFKIDCRANIDNINLANLVINIEEASSIEGKAHYFQISKCLCKNSLGEEFQGIIIQNNMSEQDKLASNYMAFTILPLNFINIAATQNKYKAEEQKLVYLKEISNQAPLGILLIDEKDNIIKANTYIKNLFALEINNTETASYDFSENDKDFSEKGRFANQSMDTYNYWKKINYEDSRNEDKLLKKLEYKSLPEIFGPKEKFWHTNSLNTPREQELGRQEQELQLETLQGRKLLKFIMVPILDKKIIYIIDLTYNKGLEAEIKLSQGLQTIGQIASVVAHDFNNLLTAMMSFTHFAQERQAEDDPARADLEQLQQVANRSKVMIKQLLTFSRKQDLKAVIFDLNSEISDLMTTILRLMGDRIIPAFVRGKNVGNILMDKVQFQQIITNLVVNAKDAMRKGGKLDIITTSINLATSKEGVIGTIPPGEYALIELKDSGEGIGKENIKLIFQSYFSTKGDKGNGLGLSTVTKIVKDSAGFLDVKSVLGKGTSFYLYFPKAYEEQLLPKDFKISEQQSPSEQIVYTNHETVSNLKIAKKSKEITKATEGELALPFKLTSLKEARLKEEDQETVDSSKIKENKENIYSAIISQKQNIRKKDLIDLTGTETILLVEDELPVRMVCCRLLKSKGYTVIEAQSGFEALELIKEKNLTHLDLIISDVMMPGMSGPETISMVREIFPEVKTILMSGYEEEILNDIDGDISLKGIYFLAKPFTPDVFAAKVKSVIKQ